MEENRFIEAQPVTGDGLSYTWPQRRRDPEALAQEESGVPVEWNVGDVILDLYEVTDFLGQGATGKVYRVHHREWNLDLAVKTPKPEVISSVGGVENFERECQTWVDLGLHPYTVSCYYVRRLGGIPRVFVEFGEGGTLKDWIADKRLYEGGPDRALPRMLDIAIRFVWGLHYAHENGLVHQDVKPGNVVMTLEGTPKVCDFGTALARVMVHGEDSQTEGEGVEVSYAGMTPPYCSPEQKRAWEGTAEEHRTRLTLQTDIWSWGVSILEMFTGGLRWSWGIAAPEALEEYLSKDPEDEAIPRMPEGLADLLRHCFQQNPQERPKDMLEVVTVLQEIYEHEVGLAYPREAPKAAELLAAALNNRAVSLFDLGREKEATAALEEALKVDPAHPEAVFNDAVLQWQKAEITDLDVVRRLELMIQSHPGEWHPHYLLGLVHMCRRDAEGAEHCLGEALRLAPDEKQCTASLEYVRKNKDQWPHCSLVLEGHTDSINSVAITPDGRFALSGSSDLTLRLWDLASGECLRILKGHTHEVSSAAITPDGRFALSGSSDKILRLWDLSTGECLRILEGYVDGVKSVAITPDGRFAISGSWENTLYLWDLTSGECLRTLDGFWVLSVSITPDGRFTLSGSWDNTLRLWDLTSGECLRILEGHTGIVESVAMTPDGRFALSGGGHNDNTLRLWDLTTGECLRTLGGHTHWVLSVAVSVDGRLALSGSSDKTLRLWNLVSGECLRTFEGHTETVCSVAITLNGLVALFGKRDRTLHLWDLGRDDIDQLALMVARPRTVGEELSLYSHTATTMKDVEKCFKEGNRERIPSLMKKLRDLRGNDRYPELMRFLNRTGLYGKRVSLEQYRCLRILRGHTRRIYSVAIAPDGRFALSGSDDGTVRFWDLASGMCLRILEGHSRWVYSVAITRDGRFALSGSGDKTVRLWNLADGECLQVFHGHTGWIDSVAITSDSRFALSGSWDHAVRVWDMTTGECIQTIEGHLRQVNSLAITPDSRFALTGSNDNSIRIWDLASGECLMVLEGHVHQVNSLAITPDSHYVVSGSVDRTLRLWEMASGECRQTFQGHVGWVKSVAIFADGRFAISGSRDKSLLMWDLFTSKCLCTLEGHTDDITSVAISSGGHLVISGSADHTLRLWELDWEYEFPEPADWDEGAKPYLEVFLTLHTPYGSDGISRNGKPTWTDEDFQQLLTELGYCGYGWLRPEGVRKQLEKMTADWQGPPDLFRHYS